MGCLTFPPDEVALVAAHQDGFYRSKPFDTFQIVDGVARRVAPAQWPQFVIELDALSEKLKAEQCSHLEGYARWKDEAIAKLPAGVFVWLEEFQSWFSRTRSLLTDDVGPDEEDGGGELRYESDELHLSPLVPLDLRDCIREGFEALFDGPRPFESLIGALESSFDKPLNQLSAWQRYRVRSDLFPSPWDELDEEQRRSLAARWDYMHDPTSAAERDLEYSAAFNEFDKAAELAGHSALEAAQLLLTRDGELLNRLGVPCPDTDVPPLARRLLTLEEMRTTGVERTFHHLSEWLRRAREQGIECPPSLHWAVEHRGGSSCPHVLEEQESVSVEGPEPWIVRAREHADNIWLRELANNKRPEKRGIASEIAARLWRDDKMVTKGNKRIGPDYIVRFALSPSANGGWQPPPPD
ncbi:MAG: hypothetical protein KDH15_13635 [Rhodocyclaceae bacterium]|nr:hypothetical protein [Rhodocyclaceae bacterium]